MGFSWAFINPAADNPPDLSVTTSGLAATASLAAQGLTASVAGGTAGYVYAWSSVKPNGSTSTSEFSTTSGSTTLFTPAATGLYTVTCTVTDSSTVTLTASSAQSKVIGTDLAVAISGISDSLSVAAQGVTASATGGTGGYAYLWSVVRPDNTTSSSEFSTTTGSNTIFTVSQKGLNILRCRVTDSSAAIVTGTSSVKLGITGSDLGVTVSGLTATSSLTPQNLSASAIGGIAPYNYSWSATRPNGSTSTSEFNSTSTGTPVFTPQRVGLYSVFCTVTDTPDVPGAGLTASSAQSKFIGQELSAVITGLAATSSVAAQALTASATGGTGSYSYAWSVSKPDGTLSTSEFSGSAPSSSVFFTVSYVGHNVVRCDITDASSVTFRATSSAEIGITGSDLSNTVTGFSAAANLNAQGLTSSVFGGITPYARTWLATRPDGSTSTSEFSGGTANASASVVFTPARVGLYSITCIATDTSTPALTASGGQAKVVGTPLSVSISGITSTTSMSPQGVTASIVGGTGSPTIAWSTANSLTGSSTSEYSTTSGSTTLYTPSLVGLNTLTVRVIDSSSTLAVATSSVSLGVTGSDFSLTTAGLAATSSLAPQGLTASPLLGGAPYSFTWSATRPDGSTSTSEFGPNATTQNPGFFPLRVGLYSVTCTATDSSTPALTASSTQAKFIGQTLNASIVGLASTNSMAAQDLTASVTGGSGSYSFTWSNANAVSSASVGEFSNFSTNPLSQSVTFTPAIVGLNVVSVRVVDQATGLTVATSSAELGVTGSDFSLTTAGLAATSSLAPQGLTATTAGGASPYSFTWSATRPDGSTSTSEFGPNATTQNPGFFPLRTGLYSVTCTATDSSSPALTASSTQAKVIGQDLNVTITGLATTASVAAQDLTASTTGGSGSYSYTWSVLPPNGVRSQTQFSNFSTNPLSQSTTFSASIQGANIVSVRTADQAGNVFFATASAFIGITGSGGSADMNVTVTGLSAAGNLNAQGLTASVFGGTAPIAFSWSSVRPDGVASTSEFSVTNQQTTVFTPSRVGLYTVTCTITDDETPALTASNAQAKFLGTPLAGVITGSSGLPLATPSSSTDISPQSVTASITGAGAGSETYSWSAIQPGDPNPTTTLYSSFSTSPLSQSATFTPTRKGIHTLLCTVTDAQSTSILLTKTIDVGTDLIKAGEMKTILVTDEWEPLQGYLSLTDAFSGSIANSTNNVGGSDHGKTTYTMTTSPSGDCKRPDHWIYRQSPPIKDFGSQFTDFRAGGTLTLKMENVETAAHDTDSEAMFGFGLVSNNYSASTPAAAAVGHTIATGTGSAGRSSGANINGTISNINNTDFVYIGFAYQASTAYAKSVNDINNQSDAFNVSTTLNPAEGAAAFGIVRVLSGGIPDANSGYGIRANGVDGNPSTINNQQNQFSGENSGDDMRYIVFMGADKDGTATFPITASFKLTVGFTPHNFPPQ